MTKILIVDDHEIVRTGVSYILEQQSSFSIIGTAKSGEEAIEIIKKSPPEIVIMDVKMPGMGGVEATRRIKLIDSSIKIIAVTSCDGDVYPSKLMRVGASAYLSKSTSPEHLLEAISIVLEDGSYVSPDIAQQLALRATSSTLSHGSPFEKLSDRELQIATLIIQGKKPTDIAKSLNISSKTINSFRYRIFEKFNVGSDVELVLFALKHKFFDLETLE